MHTHVAERLHLLKSPITRPDTTKRGRPARCARLAVAVVAAALIDLVPPRLGPGVRNPEATPAAAATQAIPTVLTGPPHALAAFRVSVVPNDEALQLQWSYNAASPHVDELNLGLYTVVKGVPYLVARTAVGNTVEGDTYTIPMPVGSWMVKATPQNNAGYGPEASSAGHDRDQSVPQRRRVRHGDARVPPRDRAARR